MVEEACKFVEQTPDKETKLKLIATLRTVTEGKVSFACRYKLHVYIIHIDFVFYHFVCLSS